MLIREWLYSKNIYPEQDLLQKAAWFQLSMFENQHDRSMEFLLATHQALQQADLQIKAAEFAIEAIGDKAGEGISLNNIANIYHAQGDYPTALDYLKQSF